MTTALTDRDQLAFSLFIALLRNKRNKVNLHLQISGNEIRKCFILADSFLRITRESRTSDEKIDVTRNVRT